MFEFNLALPTEQCRTYALYLHNCKCASSLAVLGACVHMAAALCTCDNAESRQHSSSSSASHEQCVHVGNAEGTLSGRSFSMSK